MERRFCSSTPASRCVFGDPGFGITWAHKPGCSRPVDQMGEQREEQGVRKGTFERKNNPSFSVIVSSHSLLVKNSTMSRVENKILKAQRPFEPVCLAQDQDSIIKHIFEKLDDLLADGQGGRPWMTDITEFERPKVQHLSQVKPLAFKAASAFTKLGLEAGDVVQFYLPNCVDYYIPLFGAWLCGAIVSLTSSTLKVPAIQSQIEDTQPKVLLCYQGNLATIEQAITGQTLIALNTDGDESTDHLSYERFLDMGEAEPFQLPVTQVDQCTMILWSSGTTGLPKGIQHSHRNMLNLVQPIVSPNPYSYTTTMFYHMGGYHLAVSGAIFGNVNVVFHGFNHIVTGVEIMEAAHKYKPNLMFIWTHHGVELAMAKPRPDLDLSSVTAISPLGSSLDTNLLEDLKPKFPNCKAILNYYGMTELGSISMGHTPTSMGSLLNGREVKIVDPNTQELLGANQIGEMWVKTPITTIGYINRPGLNEKSFAPDGFYKTGDLGYYDEAGLLYFHDRLKDLIKYKNNQVYPVELETVLMEHPEIAEVAVYGTPEPAVQELISACVVKTPGSTLSEADVRAWVVHADVDDGKLIRGPVKFVSHLPKNAHGKILRKLLQDHC
eukprot:maker-scaffold974_size74728-snap-gene-0.20 protein:Tk09218 transcript:maker-scaffold974_size74728-snap-gene-0.20-mRNA-1 annotation:"luciferin 4-monooxygenase"